MESEIWKLLAGVLAASNTAVIWLLIKAKRNGHQESPEAITARHEAVTRIIEHIDAAERRVMKNVDDTRHSLAGAIQEQTAEMVTSVKEYGTRRRG